VTGKFRGRSLFKISMRFPAFSLGYKAGESVGIFALAIAKRRIVERE